jgi:DNA-binding NarL/FixJ family response regulator
MTETIRIVIADDHPIFRFGMRTLIDATSDMSVVGEAATGEEAIALADTCVPDLLLMDIVMPGLSGIEATAHIHERHPQMVIFIVSMLDDESVFEAMRAGARGYILKGTAPAEMLAAIRAAASGEAIFSARIAERLTAYFVKPSVQPTREVLAFPELTTREREILVLLARGFTNTNIADRLALSPKTVRNYISEIFTKLQVADRSQAIVRARDAGID